VLTLWTAGVPALAGGLALDRSAVFSAGGEALGAAVVLSAANAAIVLARSRRRVR
jgi:hypothetical protein